MKVFAVMQYVSVKPEYLHIVSKDDCRFALFPREIPVDTIIIQCTSLNKAFPN